jgi:hypothetical protein
MAPTRRTAGPSNESPEETLQDSPQDLATANAEIDRLRGLLATQNTPPSNETLNHDRLAEVLEAFSQRFARDDSPTRPTKSAKIPDPPILMDGKEPTFEN